jgi:hypothetical protein
MKKNHVTRKFRKLRKGSKKYFTHRNKSGGTLGTFARSLTADGRLLEEFKSKIRGVESFGELLDNPYNTMEDKLVALTNSANDLHVNNSKEFNDLKIFIRNNYTDLKRILENDTSIKRKEFYNKVIEKVHDDSSSATDSPPPIPPIPPLPPFIPKREISPSMSDRYWKAIKNNEGKYVYVFPNLKCPYNRSYGEPELLTLDDIDFDQPIPNYALCILCGKSKRSHILNKETQQGGSRRRRRTMRSRKNKTRRNGKCRACRCPGGCKRSTCPCYRGRSKPCCTKRCRSRGHGCRC